MHLRIGRTFTGAIALVIVLGTIGCSRTKTIEEEGKEVTVPTARDYLFAADFEDRSLDAWKVVTGTWRAGRGVLTLWGRGTGHDTKNEIKIITLADSPPRNCRIEVDVRFLSPPRAEAFAGILFRYQDGFNFYWFRFCDFEKYQDRYEIYEFFKGQRNIRLGSGQITFNPDQWYRVAVEVEDANLRAYLDGKEVTNLVNPNLATGTVGLATKKTANVEFRRFRVLAL